LPFSAPSALGISSVPRGTHAAPYALSDGRRLPTGPSHSRRPPHAQGRASVWWLSVDYDSVVNNNSGALRGVLRTGRVFPRDRRCADFCLPSAIQCSRYPAVPASTASDSGRYSAGASQASHPSADGRRAERSCCEDSNAKSATTRRADAKSQ